jgi:hypothetical protein
MENRQRLNGKNRRTVDRAIDSVLECERAFRNVFNQPRSGTSLHISEKRD